MKTMVKSERMPAEAKFTWKRVRNSMKVAEWYWTATFVLMMLAGGAENVIMTMVGVALLAHATLHRLKVEKRKEKKDAGAGK